MTSMSQNLGRITLINLFHGILGEKIMEFLEVEEGLTLEEVTKQIRLGEEYWTALVASAINNRGPNLPFVKVLLSNSQRELYKLVSFLKKGLQREPVNLISECFEVNKNYKLSCSSVDREEESPVNVRNKSLCHELLSAHNLLGRTIPDDEPTVETLTPMAHAQIRCGCADTSPCYYCCKASPTADMEEWLDMSLSRFAYLSDSRLRTRQQRREMERFESFGDVVMINKFAIVPYRSYMQPKGPIYCPQRVKLQIWYETGSGSQKYLYYESQEYVVEHREGEQTFALPQPITLLTSHAPNSGSYIVRFMFLGSQQRQTFGAHTGIVHHNWYYICISQVMLYGTSAQRIASIYGSLAQEHISRSGSSSSSDSGGGGRADASSKYCLQHLARVEPISRARVAVSEPCPLSVAVGPHHKDIASWCWSADL